MTPRLQPKQTLMLRADVTIGDCVRLMRDHNVGSVLVMTDDNEGKLIGIFTERDLLKNIELIQNGEHWSRPVRTVMTKNPVTVKLTQLQDAASLMLRHGIRHLPVVAGDGSVAGVVSMRDLFRDFAEHYEAEARRTKTEKLQAIKGPYPALGIVSDTSHFIELLSRGIAALPKTSMCRFGHDDYSDFERLRALIIDLDCIPRAAWDKLIQWLKESKAAPNTILVYNPIEHGEKDAGFLARIKTNARLEIFTKPFSISIFFKKLLQLLSEEP